MSCTFTLAAVGKTRSGREKESHLLMALLSYVVNVSGYRGFMSIPHSGAHQTALNGCLWAWSAGRQ